jgi:hypothetical protein
MNILNNLILVVIGLVIFIILSIIVKVFLPKPTFSEEFLNHLVSVLIYAFNLFIAIYITKLLEEYKKKKAK